MPWKDYLQTLSECAFGYICNFFSHPYRPIEGLTFGSKIVPSEIRPDTHPTILEYESNYLGLLDSKGIYKKVFITDVTL